MLNKILLALAATALALTMGLSSAAAQEPATGVPGEPNCHGKRVSFGSSVFGITPKDRAGFLGEMAGHEVKVREFQERVRASCEAAQ